MSAVFKGKKLYILLLVILVVAGFVYMRYKKASQPVSYDTIRVERGDLKQTVEATGKVESVSDVSLRFDTAGTVEQINAVDGSKVKAGDTLAALRLAELNAAVAQAQANLNQKLAGATTADLDYYRAAVDGAKASWNQAIVDGNSAIATAQSAVETAKNNLKLAEGGENSQIVSSAYRDAVALSQAALSTLDNALTQADNILGIDNTFANQDFKIYLSASDPNKLNMAQGAYFIARAARDAAKSPVLPLTTLSPRADIDDALNLIEVALAKANQLLVFVRDVLAVTLPGGSLTQSALDAKKSTMETTRAAVTAQYTAVISQIQSIADAKNSYGTYSIAYLKAQNDLAAAKATADNNVKIKEAAYNQALANLQNKLNPPREVDVAAYRAALAQAIAARAKAIIRAPIDGIVTKVNKKKGESASVADVVMEMLSPHYEVKVDIPETDIPKLSVGNSATITLDAFGDDMKFSGQIVSIDPGATEIQDVVYYKVRVALAETDKQIKSGMTANITAATDKRENVLYVPSRAVRSNGEKYVRVLVGDEIKDMPVKLGLKADDGKVEILAGVKEGDAVVLGTK